MIPAREYALVFGTAVVVTFLLTGVVRLLAVQIGAVTPIRDRDVHSLPIPRMGGVAVLRSNFRRGGEFAGRRVLCGLV